MPNPYYEMFSDFGDRVNAGIREGQRMQAFSGGMPTRPDGSVDYQRLAQMFLQQGDKASALAVARLAESQADDARTEQYRREMTDYRNRSLAQGEQQERRITGQNERAQRNFEREQTFREKQAELAGKGWSTERIKQPDGSERMAFVNVATKEVVYPDEAAPGSGARAPINPYSQGKMTEGQGKASSYADRIAEAEDIFEGPFNEETGTRDTSKETISAALDPDQAAADKLGRSTGALGRMGANYYVTPQYRQYRQAASNFINANLRRESGATIQPSEFAEAEQQYLPVPNDDPQTLKNKAANRRTVYEGMAREAGASYRPKPAYLPRPEAGAEEQPPGPQIAPVTGDLRNIPLPGQALPGTPQPGGGPPPPPGVAPGAMGNDPKVGAAFAARAPGGAAMRNAGPPPDLARLQMMGDALAKRGVPKELIIERLRQAYGLGGGPPPPTAATPAPTRSLGRGPVGAGPVAAASQVPFPQPQGPPPSFAGQAVGQPPPGFDQPPGMMQGGPPPMPPQQGMPAPMPGGPPAMPPFRPPPWLPQPPQPPIGQTPPMMLPPQVPY